MNIFKELYRLVFLEKLAWPAKRVRQSVSNQLISKDSAQRRGSKNCPGLTQGGREDFERRLLTLVPVLSPHLGSEIFLEIDASLGKAEISGGKKVLAEIEVMTSEDSEGGLLIRTALSPECNAFFASAFEDCPLRVFKPL